MKKSISAIAIIVALGSAGAHAANITPGATLTGVNVAGQASVYHVFGHPGDPGGDWGPDLPAVLTTFSAGAGNVFTFSATGLVSCCSNSPDIPPDGAGSGMNIGGANGLSGLSGNAVVPLVGVFTSNTDPYGSSAPSSLSFDASNPVSISPLLNQVFYIGDGRAGYNNPLGAQLAFTAPTTSSRLYLGVIDAYGFGGVTGYYNDNKGAFTADIHLNAVAGGVPEPAAWAMLLMGFGGLGALLRGRRTQAGFRPA